MLKDLFFVAILFIKCQIKYLIKIVKYEAVVMLTQNKSLVLIILKNILTFFKNTYFNDSCRSPLSFNSQQKSLFQLRLLQEPLSFNSQRVCFCLKLTINALKQHKNKLKLLVLSKNILFGLNMTMIMAATSIITMTMTMTATIVKNMITNMNIFKIMTIACLLK